VLANARLPLILLLSLMLGRSSAGQQFGPLSWNTGPSSRAASGTTTLRVRPAARFAPQNGAAASDDVDLDMVNQPSAGDPAAKPATKRQLPPALQTTPPPLDMPSDTDKPEEPDDGKVDMLPEKDRLKVQPEELAPVPMEELQNQPDPNMNWSPDGPAPIASSGSCLYRGRFYVQADAVYMNRTGPVPLGLATDLGSPTQQQLRTAPSLGFAPMARITFGALLGRDAKNRDHSIDFTYLGPGNWHQSQGITSLAAFGLFSLLDPAQAVGFSHTHVDTFRYESNFNSYELNYRVRRRLGRDRMELAYDGSWVRKCTPVITPSFFFGIRNIVINEHFNFSTAGPNPAILSGNYDVQTHNNLLGLQVGGDLMYQYCNWRIGARAKAGPYINTAGASSRVVIVDQVTPGVANPIDRDESARNRPLAFFGEFSLLGAYQIRSNMAFRASFDLMFASSLALGPSQLVYQIPVPPRVDTSGFLTYSGGSLGFEYVW
jgi:hypothetical protein